MVSEINFVLYDKDNPDFYSNKVQKIGTTISSLCSINFMKHYLASDDPPDILGETVFEVTVTGLPSKADTAEYLLWRQQIAVSNAVNATAEYEMLKYEDKAQVQASLNRKEHCRKEESIV